MGDHRFSFKADFEMHGVKDSINIGSANWSGQLHGGIDSRITDWLEGAAAKAMRRFYERVEADRLEQNKAQIERDERSELDRLKNKYEGRT